MACQQPEKRKSWGSYFNNGGLAEWESSVRKGEVISLASTFGGTSID
jgi:hypothetical protein